MQTFLSQNAFVSMVTAAVEAYPQETLGVLIGLRGPHAIWVQYATVYQTAERDKMEVRAHPTRTRRTNRFLKKITHLELIGDFHSHTKVPINKASSIKLSRTDKKSMSQMNLGIIVAINRDKVQRNWKHLPKGSLKGSVFPYSLKIASWLKSGRDEYKLSRIECPSALGLGL